MKRIGFIKVAVPSMLALYFGMAYAPYFTFGWVEKGVYPFSTLPCHPVSVDCSQVKTDHENYVRTEYIVI